MELDPTPDELSTTKVVEEGAALAFQAPNGSSRQRWGWVLVDHAATSGGQP